MNVGDSENSIIPTLYILDRVTYFYLSQTVVAITPSMQNISLTPQDANIGLLIEISQGR